MYISICLSLATIMESNSNSIMIVFIYLICVKDKTSYCLSSYKTMKVEVKCTVYVFIYCRHKPF